MREIIDPHTHVLPKMDDGSRGTVMSIEMLKRMKAMGITVVCGTSHYYRRDESIREFCERREAALDRLSEVLTDDLPRVIPGSEVAFFHGISEEEDLEMLCYEGTRTLLLEMPFTDWTSSNVDEVRSLVLDRRLNLILAHPERFLFSKSNKEYLRRLAEMNIYFQVNGENFTSFFTRKEGLEILKMTPRRLLGSDAHNTEKRPPNLDAARSYVSRKMGAEELEQIDEAACRLILGT